jgi:hypothetical protein
MFSSLKPETPSRTGSVARFAIGCAVILLSAGCLRHRITIEAPLPEAPPPLGSTVEPSFKIQELNGEASDFVMYEHEFMGWSAHLSPEGESHLRQIAARLPHVPFPVIIESAKPDVSPDDPRYVECAEVDARRQAVVASALTMMGVPGASQRVVVGHPYSAGLTAGEADRAYNRAIGGGDGTGGGRQFGGLGMGGISGGAFGGF